MTGWCWLCEKKSILKDLSSTYSYDTSLPTYIEIFLEELTQEYSELLWLIPRLWPQEATPLFQSGASDSESKIEKRFILLEAGGMCAFVVNCNQQNMIHTLFLMCHFIVMLMIRIATMFVTIERCQKKKDDLLSSYINDTLAGEPRVERARIFL